MKKRREKKNQPDTNWFDVQPGHFCWTWDDREWNYLKEQAQKENEVIKEAREKQKIKTDIAATWEKAKRTENEEWGQEEANGIQREVWAIYGETHHEEEGEEPQESEVEEEREVGHREEREQEEREEKGEDYEDVEVDSVNVTSLLGSVDMLAKMKAHIIFLQETAATKAMAKKAARALRKKGWKLWVSPVTTAIKAQE